MKSVEVMEKIKKAPDILWYFVLAASLFFKNFYQVGQSLKALPEFLAELGLDTEMIAQAQGSFNEGLFYVFSTLFALMFFEFMVYLAYNTFARRRLLLPHVTQKEFALPIRATYSLGNICVGLISLNYFWLPESALYSFPPIVFAFDSAAFILAYQLIKNSGYIIRGGLKASFSLFTRTYAGIVLALSVFNLLMSLDGEKYFLMAQIANLILVMLFWLISGKITSELAKKDIEDINSIEQEKPPEIFKGFGF